MSARRGREWLAGALALVLGACGGGASDPVAVSDAARPGVDAATPGVDAASPPLDAARAVDRGAAPDAAPTVTDDGLDGSPDVPVGDAALANDAGGQDAVSTPDADFERDPARLNLRGPCAAERRFGGFKVESNESEGYTAVDGVVRDGVPPGMVPEVAGAEGDCRLFRARRLVCDPPCSAGTTCGTEATCVPQPLGQDMGPVVLRGLVAPLELLPLQPGNTYFYTRLPHPGFTVGRVVHLSNTPGYLGPLALSGVGVEPVTALDATWTLVEGAGLTLRWQPPVMAYGARVLVEINIDQHGRSPLTLVCDLPDTGEALLPVPATDALIAAGVTGFPSGRLTRRTVDSSEDADRCVEFAVTSVRPVPVSVEGHIPCARDADCPVPQTCDLPIQQCH
ncbi:hypothetical protein L6V77_20230 [Myxococcota bacterium]|nr:hypothetical protein [Myxococcota bacterium]